MFYVCVMKYVIWPSDSSVIAQIFSNLFQTLVVDINNYWDHICHIVLHQKLSQWRALPHLVMNFGSLYRSWEN